MTQSLDRRKETLRTVDEDAKMSLHRDLRMYLTHWNSLHHHGHHRDLHRILRRKT